VRGTHAGADRACESDAAPKQCAAIDEAITGDKFERRGFTAATLTLAHDHLPIGWTASRSTMHVRCCSPQRMRILSSRDVDFLQVSYTIGETN
jgi:hypothetical protein